MRVTEHEKKNRKMENGILSEQDGVMHKFAWRENNEYELTKRIEILFYPFVTIDLGITSTAGVH